MDGGGWTFLTNHARVLLCIAGDPDVLLRDAAAQIGITERAAQRIVRDLEDAGYLLRERVGRRNRYKIDFESGMRHPLHGEMQIGDLLRCLRVGPQADG